MKKYFFFGKSIRKTTHQIVELNLSISGVSYKYYACMNGSLKYEPNEGEIN
jgi:hypothetical protein